MEIFFINIDYLKLSQIYLSQKKIDGVNTWFEPSLRNFEPVSVRDFLNNENLHLTDGHTRTFIAWQHGVKQIPCVYDEDEIVTCKLGQIQYEEDILWCNRFQLNHISDLAHRILPEDDYEELWRGRCDKMYNLEVALLEGKIYFDELKRKKEKLIKKDLFIYGISKNLAVLYFENKLGELFEAPYCSL